MLEEQAIAQQDAYPPEPWRLTGDLQASIWLVGRRDLPFEPPPGWRPVSILGRRLVGGVWAAYGWDGDLAYRELAVGVAVRKGLRLAVTLPWIWVDDGRSLAGGRELWAIPKQLARFAGPEARDLAGGLLAAAGQDRRLPLPGRWPIAFQITQRRGETAVLTPARVVARLAFGASEWRAHGPLGFLDRRRPLLTVRLERAVLQFGAAGRF